MIQDVKYWTAWEDALRANPPDFRENLRLLDAMYEEAKALGLFLPADSLAGLEVKIRMARVVNVCRASRTDRTEV